MFLRTRVAKFHIPQAIVTAIVTLTIFSTPCYAQVRYRVSRVNVSAPDSAYVLGTAINNDGTVLGTLLDFSGDGRSVEQSFLVPFGETAQVFDFDDMKGIALNNAGLAVARSSTRNCGVLITLQSKECIGLDSSDFPRPPYTHFYDINDRNVILGATSSGFFEYDLASDKVRRISGLNFEPHQLNSNGLIIGQQHTYRMASYYFNGRNQFPITGIDVESYMVDVNDNNEMVANTTTRPGTNSYIMRAKKITAGTSTVEDLVPLAGYNHSYVAAINNNGQIIGASYLPELPSLPLSAVVLWENSRPIAVEERIEHFPGDPVLTYAWAKDISDGGQVLIEGRERDSQSTNLQLFILTPALGTDPAATPTNHK